MEFVSILLLFYVLCVLALRHVGSEIKSAPPALEGKVLTSGPPGKSLYFVLNEIKIIQSSKCVIISILVSYKMYKAYESNCNHFLRQLISQ